jgi:hypothetical protein
MHENVGVTSCRNYLRDFEICHKYADEMALVSNEAEIGITYIIERSTYAL